MTIESFIEEPDGSKQAHVLFTIPGSGNLYTSYPNGPGNFEAIAVHCTGDTTAEVHEIIDGNSLQLGFDLTKLPEGTKTTLVDPNTPFKRDLVSPAGFPGSLVVRHVARL